MSGEASCTNTRRSITPARPSPTNGPTPTGWVVPSPGFSQAARRPFARLALMASLAVRSRTHSRIGDPMRLFSMSPTSIKDPVLVVLKTHGALSVTSEIMTSPSHTFSYSRVHLPPRAGVIFLPSSVSWTHKYSALMLATLMRGTVFTVKAPESTQSSATKTSTHSKQSSVPTAHPAQPKKPILKDV